MSWEDLLLQAGIELLPTGGRRSADSSADVRLRTPQGDAVVRVRSCKRPPRPSEVRRLIDDQAHADTPLLLVADRLSPQVRHLLAQARVSSASDRHAELFLDTGHISFSLDEAPAPPERDAPGTGIVQLPWRGRSAFQVTRRIIQRGLHLPQEQLARDAGVSQPRVSQVLAALGELGLVDLRQRAVIDLEALLDAWVAHYPGPGGPETRWFASGGAQAGVAAALDHAQRDNVAVLLSGDLAADHLAPFALPTAAVLYADDVLDLTPAGLVRTPDRETAVVTVVTAQDPTVRPPVGVETAEATVARTTCRLADHLQVLWDVNRSRNTDAAQQAAHLRRQLLEWYEPAHGRWGKG
jgi:DNA-binding transcriptional ArsR family regulator